MNQELLDQFIVIANLPGNQSYLLSHKQTNEIFVFKTLQSSLSFDDLKRAISKRYTDLQNCKNLCTICYYTTQQPSTISIVYSEPKINFRKEISARIPKKQYWSYEELLNTIWHALVALNSFHYVGLFHGDIRVNSIACRSDGSILLLDQFCTGNSFYKTVKEIISDQDGFLSPELLDPKQDLMFTTIENDVFSLGLVFMEACTLKRSRDFYNWNQLSFNYQAYQERLVDVESLYSHKLAQLIAKMTDFNVQTRITTEEALVEISHLKQTINVRDNQQPRANNIQQYQQNNNQQQHGYQKFNQQQQPLSSQSIQSSHQSPLHYLDQSLSQKTVQTLRENNNEEQSNNHLGNSFDEAIYQMNNQNQAQKDYFADAYNVQVLKDSQRPSQANSKQNFKINLNYNKQNDSNQKAHFTIAEQSTGKFSQLATQETAKDYSRNQEITQFENLSISDNSVSILSFENTMCSHNEDLNFEKRRQIPNYKKSVFKVKDLLSAPSAQVEKESSVFYLVEEEEGIDKDFIQKTMVNRIEKEKRELDQIQFHSQQFQKSHPDQQQMKQISQQGSINYNQNLQQSKQLYHYNQGQGNISLVNQQTTHNNLSQSNQGINQRAPANPFSKQINIQVRRNSAYNTHQNQPISSQLNQQISSHQNHQILSQKENINQNKGQVLDEYNPMIQNGGVHNEQAATMAPDNMSNKLNQTRKIRGLNKSVDMSKTISQINNNSQNLQNNNNKHHTNLMINQQANQINQFGNPETIASCKYSEKQEIIFPQNNRVMNSAYHNNEQLVECNGINAISYDIKYLQSPSNLNQKEQKMAHPIFSKQQQLNQNNQNLTYNYNRSAKEQPITQNNSLINKQQSIQKLTNCINQQTNNSNHNNNNDEWNYPSNSQRFAYIQIKQ